MEEYYVIGIKTHLRSHFRKVLSSAIVIILFGSTNKHLFMVPSCPSRVSGSVFVFSRSKSRIFFSCPPVRSFWPSAEKSTDRTIWLCWNECISSPVRAHQIFASKSALPVAAREQLKLLRYDICYVMFFSDVSSYFKIQEIRNFVIT